MAPEEPGWPSSAPGCAISLALLGPVVLAFFALGSNVPSWQSGELSDYLALFVRQTSYVFVPLAIYSTICLALAAFDRRTALAYFAVRFGVYSGVLLSVQPVVLWIVLTAVSAGGDDAPFVIAGLAAVGCAGFFFPLAVARVVRDATRRNVRWSAGLSAVTLIAVAAFVVLGPLFVAAALFAAPLWTIASYAIASRAVYRRYGGRGQLRLSDLFGVLTWSSLYLASWRISVTLALDKYATLPKTPPRCYVCTAAAHGHRWLIRSQPRRSADGSVFLVTRQMQRLKCAELALMTSLPRLHCALRRVYDRVGPRLAARIRYPLMADLAYLAFKPAEWLANALGRRLLPQFDALAGSLYADDGQSP